MHVGAVEWRRVGKNRRGVPLAFTYLSTIRSDEGFRCCAYVGAPALRCMPPWLLVVLADGPWGANGKHSGDRRSARPFGGGGFYFSVCFLKFRLLGADGVGVVFRCSMSRIRAAKLFGMQ